MPDPIPWVALTSACAARSGHLEVLRWAREHGCPWDEGTCEAATENGHREVVQWARENGCPWDSNVLRAWREVCPELRELWDESEPVTAWQGVMFGEAGGADAGRVVMIDLFGLNLTGDVPADIGGLTALTTLYLGWNLLTSVPAALGGLTATWLDLNMNLLKSVPAALDEGGALEQRGCHIIR